MHIKIAEKLKPFCHLPGSSSILPGTCYQLQIFPTRLHIYDLSSSLPQLQGEIQLDILGPLKDFTVQNDLEKGEIRVWGETASGFLRYSLKSYKNGSAIRLHVEKAPQDILKVVILNQLFFLKPKESYSFSLKGSLIDQELFNPADLERLSLGCHKSQDWEMLYRRQDLAEIFPVWHRLGQLLPSLPIIQHPGEGSLELLQQCKNAMNQNRPEQLSSHWLRLFLAGFSSLLVPRLHDDCYQGIIEQKAAPISNQSSLPLLTEAAKLIRAIFFQYQDFQMHLLPTLLPQFHCGRLLGIKLPHGVFSMEWTKKQIRRCEFNVQHDGQFKLNFRHAKQCRMRKNGQDKGEKVLAGQPIDLEKNYHYFFDNFS